MRRVFADRVPGQPVSALIAAMWTSFCAPGFGEAHADLVDELVAQVVRRVTPTAAVNTQMRAIAAWHGPERLRRIVCPTVVVHGDQDRLMPVGNGMRLSRLIPGARYVELADVGHIVPMESAAELAQLTLELT
jgi:pimeloyl-ACP methyl ester carboxylesterase